MSNAPLAASLLLITSALTPAAAQADIPGSKDHPLITRYPGSTIWEYREENYFGLDIPSGPVVVRDGKYAWQAARKAEGKFTRLRYRGPVGRTSLEIFRNFQQALRNAGARTLYLCERAQCDNLAFLLFQSSDGPLSGNRANEYFEAAQLAGPRGSVFVRLYVTQNQNTPELYPPESRVAVGQPVMQIEIVETTAMDAGLVSVNAAAMRKAIAETGRVALYGIYFETAKATVKPESKPALEEIAKLLQAEPSLRLLVVGHTDTVGGMEANRQLSLQRAEAVIAALTGGYGASAARLQPAGVGFAAPVASNRDEAGRAKNRRVELVEF